MSCFNNLANCCTPPEPPEGCCITQEELDTLFEGGLSLSVGGTSVSFNHANWQINGCCASNTVNLSISPAKQCTSDWSYLVTEVVKCEETVAKKKTKYINVDPILGINLCPQNECPEIILAGRAVNSLTEKGERVVASELRYGQATVTIGKFLRICGSGGISECVYVIGVTMSIQLYGGGIDSVYQSFTSELDFVDPDLLACCTQSSVPPVTVQDVKDSWYYTSQIGSDQFPLCNYLPEDAGLGLISSIEISRVKVLTSITGPISFTKDDPAPEFCDRPAFCLGPINQSVEKITTTFNRTRPPVYSSRSYVRGAGTELCCINRVINSFTNPDTAYDVVGPSKWTKKGPHTLVQPPPLGTNYTVWPGNRSDCPNIIGFGSCMCLLPPNTVWEGVGNCCDFPVFPASQPDYLPDGYTRYVDSFSYVSNIGNDPIIHEYPIGSWNLTF